jgi:hypothetical protein
MQYGSTNSIDGISGRIIELTFLRGVNYFYWFDLLF